MAVNTLDPWEVPAANGEPVSLLTFPAPIPAPRAAEQAEQQVEPLGGGWIAVAVVIGVMAALVALGGMVLSFRAVSAEMTPAFGARWSWLVPIVVDLTVFVFSGVDLVLARMNMSHPLARLTVYGATFGTVYLNYSAGGDAAGRAAHVLMPSIWVVFIELMRHVVRRQTNLATGSQREPIPASRWLVSPWPTLKLWRRMILWRTNSYPRALETERRRLGAIAAARAVHGRSWRWRVDALTRLRISLGEVGPADIYAHLVSATMSATDQDTGSATVAATGQDTVAATQRDTEADNGRATEQDTVSATRRATKPRQSAPRTRTQGTAQKVQAARTKHPEWTRQQISHALKLSERTVSRYYNDPKDGTE